MSSLTELEQVRDALVELIIDAFEQPEDSVDLQIQLEQLESEIADKVDAIAAVFAAKNGEIAYLKERRDYFDRLIKSKENALDRFKDYLKMTLERRAGNTIAGREAKLRLVKNGGKQPLWINHTIRPQDFPKELVVTQTSYSVSTEVIREKLNDSGGEELIVNGEILAKLEPRGTHLRIG
jgi:Siphovirus Gp157